MRLIPDSITGRTVGLLFSGLILTIAASLAVYMLDIFHGKGWEETFRNLQRIAVITSIMEPATADARLAWLPILKESGLSIAWNSGQTPPPLRQNNVTRHLARDIRVYAKIPLKQRVLTGYPAETGLESHWFMPDPGPAQVWIELSDQTWLRFTIAQEKLGGLWTLRLVLASGLLLAGITVLGIWAAHRVTAPLARFSLAAERLGTNVDAPPMLTSGPSEIRQAATAFNAMQQRIRRLIEDRALMQAALSHDLRTALTRLRFRSEFINNPEQRQKAIADLDEMQAMLLATLSFARDEAAAEAPIPVDLAVLLQSLCDDFQDTGKTAVYSGPPHMNHLVRPALMRRAVANLIDNAVTYGKQAAVTLTSQPHALVITIADRGPGIPQPMRGQVFEPYFRLEPSRSRETGGTGLGMTVARTIIHRHGGDIELADRAGGGLLLRIVLPYPSSESV